MFRTPPNYEIIIILFIIQLQFWRRFKHIQNKFNTIQIKLILLTGGIDINFI